MKKLFSLFTVLMSVSMYAQSTYSIKLGAYHNLDNAKKIKANSKQSDIYILDSGAFYRVFSGHFESKQEAKKYLRRAKKEHKDAYVTLVDIEDREAVVPIEIGYQPLVVQKVHKRVQKSPFNIAKAYYHEGRYEEALTIYDQILIKNPNNHLVRLEYARTLYQLGFYKDAKKEFLLVLHTNPPQRVKNNIQAYLKKIKDSLTENIFYGLVELGLTYDDNLGFNTHLKTTRYGTLELQNDTNMTKGFYETANFALTHIYVSEDFSWTNTLYSYNEIQNEDIDNLNFLSFTTAPAQRYDNFKLSLPLSLSNVWIAGSTYSFNTSVQPTVDFSIDKSTSVALSLKYQDTKVSDNNQKDYTTYGARVSVVKMFDKLTLYASGAFEKDKRAEGVRYDVEKDRVFTLVGIYYQLFKDTTLYLGGHYNLDKYAFVDPVLAYQREDTKTGYSLSVKQKLIKELSVSLLANTLENDSNINSYSYKKNNYTISFQYDF